MALYINENDISQSRNCWYDYIQVIEKAVICLNELDYVQPLKSYLRFNSPDNRIITMPAYLGGEFNMAGNKWIASFPGNVREGLPRAHSVVVLNNAATGEPLAIINTPQLSIVRTTAVSGLLLKQYLRHRPAPKINLGINGWGPIGRHHYKMCCEIMGPQLQNVFLHDIRGIDPASIEPSSGKVIITNSWERVYQESDVFITCTVAKQPYINKEPKPASLHLNVSLRDYTTGIYPYFRNGIIVDDWEEVCRENTDVERFHLEGGLRKEETRTLADVIAGNAMAQYEPKTPLMFNPMGMAVFDIAVGTYLYKKLLQNNGGQVLN
ncbi:MAG: 2,3-diaminopropionate for siderophore biosynthesis protein SbnB [uncultured Cytophagales bacterium]|uniref:2,3-diaminopropionate for siderophore biosynthesis protein SbnB n=1 Tax=uncultured Cytophagales bacterium TaxID=158755 RepID=A0A6J4IHA6_9SPHI|nr:MAG: 2,3-diaminopropionate for siderophore biosynthesis protein SbnB [uncultured Cytophagales bacterium]